MDIVTDRARRHAHLFPDFAVRHAKGKALQNHVAVLLDTFIIGYTVLILRESSTLLFFLCADGFHKHLLFFGDMEILDEGFAFGQIIQGLVCNGEDLIIRQRFSEFLIHLTNLLQLNLL